MNQVLEWVKANVAIVIFIIVMIAAPIVMYFVASGMNQKVRSEVSSRANSLTQLTVTVPLPDGRMVVPTEKLLEEYEQVSKTLADDAAAVQKQAMDFNRKGRGVVMPNVFPEPPFEQRETVPKQFHERLVAAYDQLLTSVHAGMPPTLDSLRDQLVGMRNRIVLQDLKKDANAPLTPEEDAQVKTKLSDSRLAIYRAKAGNIGLYLSKDSLNVPDWDQTHFPTSAQMFNWQWQFWATEDVLRAVASANKDAASVMQAPVKQITAIVIHGLPAAANPADAATAGSSGNAPARLSGGGFGDSGGGGGGAAQASGGEGSTPAPAAGAANAKVPYKPDFSGDLSGLVSNPLFDVLTIEFGLVVETARLPGVLDAISRYNFNTITNLRVEQTDSFAATERGFFYGNAPVCSVTIQMQTIWLRDWTKQFMPPATRQALGIPADAPAAPAAPTPEAPSGG